MHDYFVWFDAQDEDFEYLFYPALDVEDFING